MKRMICCHSESLMHHPGQYNSILCEQTQPQHHDIMSVADGDISFRYKHPFMNMYFLNILKFPPDKLMSNLFSFSDQGPPVDPM